MIPTEIQAKNLWERYALPDDKRTHVGLVAKVALFFAREVQKTDQAIIIDEPLLRAAALLHDIDKAVPRLEGELHPDTAVRILRQENMNEVADVVVTHPLHAILDPAICPKTWEEKLLYLADKTVKFEVITVDRRFALWNAEKLPVEAQRILDESYPKVKQLENEILRIIGIEPDDIAKLVSVEYTNAVNQRRNMNIQTFAVTTSLLASSFFLPASAYAATAVLPKPTIMMVKESTTTANATAEGMTVTTTVEYALPYPGILPDHPLYLLKNLRDQIFEWLIADPIRKTEFYTLQGDKRVNMAVFLQAKGNEFMALDSLTKANTYMKSAIATAMLVKQQGKEVPGYVLDKMSNALAKHEAVVGELMLKAPEGSREKFVNAQNLVKDLRGQASKLRE